MPDFPPPAPAITPEDVWTYATRVLTNLLDARAAKIDYLTSARVRGGHVEVGFPIAPVVKTLVGGTGDLDEQTITPTIPADATLIRAKLIAMITALNMEATMHKIDITVQARKGAGDWSNVFSGTDIIGLAAVDGATQSWAGAFDVTDVVDEAGVQYGFRFSLTGSPANNVRYTQGFVLILEYRMD